MASTTNASKVTEAPSWITVPSGGLSMFTLGAELNTVTALSLQPTTASDKLNNDFKGKRDMTGSNAGLDGVAGAPVGRWGAGVCRVTQGCAAVTEAHRPPG